MHQIICHCLEFSKAWHKNNNPWKISSWVMTARAFLSSLYQWDHRSFETLHLTLHTLLSSNAYRDMLSIGTMTEQWNQWNYAILPLQAFSPKRSAFTKTSKLHASLWLDNYCHLQKPPDQANWLLQLHPLLPSYSHPFSEFILFFQNFFQKQLQQLIIKLAIMSFAKSN